MSQRPLYLASASPRRRQLLTDAEIAFVQHAVPVDEEALSDAYTGPLERLGEFLARRKAKAAWHDLRERDREGLVLAADTTVLFQSRSLPKPVDEAEALAMLRALRGQEHIVATGVALARLDGGAMRSATALTQVRMRNYDDDELRTYVASGDPRDKAGAYSIQHPGFHPVASFRGCYPNVVGLPVCLVAALLGRGPLPPLVRPGMPGTSSAHRCRWSSRCAAPLPGADALVSALDDCAEA